MIEEIEDIDREKYFKLFENFKLQSDNNKIYKEDSKILIIDFLNTFVRSWTGSPAMNDDGEHIGGLTGFLYSIGNAIKITGCTKCIIVADGEGGSQRKRKIYPDYKSGRKAHSVNRAYNFNSPEEEKKSMQTQLTRLMQYIECLPVQFVSSIGVEADDIIAYIVMEIYNKPENHITIMSSDKDFLQLVDNRISVWSPTKKKMYTPATILEDYGTSSYNFLLYRILDGDKSDNISGIKGVGIKTIQKCLPIVSENKKYTLDDMIKYCEEKSVSEPKMNFYKKILESKEQLYLNEQLMQLDTPSISASAKMKITEKVTGPTNILNKYDIHLMYIHDKLSNSMKNINEWLLSTFTVLNSFALNKKEK